MTAADFLVPTKFLLIVFQLMMTIVIYFTKEENIFAGLPLTSGYGSGDYNKANSSIVGATTVSLIFLIIELLILFTGLTLYFHRLNIFQVVFHGLGALLYAWFILGSWNYDTLWILWGLLSLLPLLLESVTAGSAIFYFKKLNR